MPGEGRADLGECQSDPVLARNPISRAFCAKMMSVALDCDPEVTSIASPPAALKSSRSWSLIQSAENS